MHLCCLSLGANQGHQRALWRPMAAPGLGAQWCHGFGVTVGGFTEEEPVKLYGRRKKILIISSKPDTFIVISLKVSFSLVCRWRNWDSQWPSNILRFWSYWSRNASGVCLADSSWLTLQPMFLSPGLLGLLCEFICFSSMLFLPDFSSSFAVFLIENHTEVKTCQEQCVSAFSDCSAFYRAAQYTARGVWTSATHLLALWGVFWHFAFHLLPVVSFTWNSLVVIKLVLQLFNGSQP